MSQSPTLMTEAVTELVALGAAIASGCEPCFRHHFDTGRRLGVSREDMRKAVDVASAVKATPQRRVLETANRLLAQEESKGGAADQACGCGSRSCC